MPGPSITARLGLDGKGFQLGLKKAQSEVSHFGHEVSSDFKTALKGFFSYEAGKELFNHTIGEMNAVADLSKQYQLNTQFVQKLKHATMTTGQEFQDAGDFVMRLDAAMESSLQTDQKKLDLFNKLGISAEEMQKALDTGDKQPIVESLAKAVGAGVATPNDLRELGGRRGGKAFEWLKTLAETGDHFKAPFSDDDLQNVKEAKIALHEVEEELQAIVSKPIGAQLKYWKELIGFARNPGLGPEAMRLGNAAFKLSFGWMGIKSPWQKDVDDLDAADKGAQTGLNEEEAEKIRNKNLADITADGQKKRIENSQKLQDLAEKYSLTMDENGRPRSKSSQRTMLQSRIADLQAKKEEFAGNKLFENSDEAVDLEQKLTEAKMKLAGLGGEFRPESDSLAKIGGYTGDSGGQMQTLTDAMKRLADRANGIGIRIDWRGGGGN